MNKFSKILLVILIGMMVFSFGSSALAWEWGQPIVPCGGVGQNDCSSDCDFLSLIQNLVDFVTKGLVPVLGTLFYIAGGFFMILGGANPGMFQRGKEMMWNTTVGIIMVLASWLITNTIINTLVANPNQGAGSILWSQIQCPIIR